MANNEHTATLKITETEQSVTLPIHESTLGPHAIDVGGLVKNGYFTYDPGFVSTAACESKITFIDGKNGILLYRGYPIEQLAKHSNYLEVCYLLLQGELPSPVEMDQFHHEILHHTMVHEQVSKFFNGFRRDAHPMSTLVGMVGALSAFYHSGMHVEDESYREKVAIRLIAKMPTIAAMSYKYSLGQPFVYPQNNLGYVENFLNMMHSVPCEQYGINPVLANALDKIFILHADHEQNASTSTVRLAGSTGANPFACISSGIAALWGPAHGGANEAVLRMLHEIKDESQIEKYLKKAKDKHDPFRLMGFGHRVYKNYDPRAKVMHEICHEVLETLDLADSPLFKLALKLEKIALEDEYFIERKLYPNVDYYSGITLSALGIPVNMFTVIFAIARTVGWIAHWMEMLSMPYKLGRPRQLYTGPEKRDYQDLKVRGE